MSEFKYRETDNVKLTLPWGSLSHSFLIGFPELLLLLPSQAGVKSL